MSSGYLPFGGEEVNLLLHDIAKRYERASTIITSNLPFRQGALAVADDATLTPLLDRLLHHAHIVQISGESYRLKDRKRVEHLKVAANAQAAVLPFGVCPARWVYFGVDTLHGLVPARFRQFCRD